MGDMALSPVLASPDPTFWLGKKVLVTGHSGFVGSWLTFWLKSCGASVIGLARGNSYPISDKSSDLCQVSIRMNIKDAPALSAAVRKHKPEVVFHLAAQPLVLESYSEPLATFETNVMGTLNLLEGIRTAGYSPESIIIVTSDKVYRNDELGKPFKESDSLGGYDPYSASKAAADLSASAYLRLMDGQSVGYGIARAGNILGGGDWGSNRLVPDLVRAWSSGKEFHVKHPQSTRPWQYVLDAVLSYMVLAEAVTKDRSLSGPYNFGPPSGQVETVRQVVTEARSIWKGKPLVTFGQTLPQLESNRLSLDSSLARERLGLQNRFDLAKTVEQTITWYRLWLEGAPIQDLMRDSLLSFNEGAEVDGARN